MNRPDDELAHIFAHDMARAERGRKRLAMWAGVLGAAGALAISAALVFGNARSETPKVMPARRAVVASAPSAPQPSTQRVKIAIGDVGYEPTVVTVKHGLPVQLTIGKGEGCAAGFIMPELGVQADNSSGPATVKLDPLKQGTYRFTCAMEMVEGRLVVE